MQSNTDQETDLLSILSKEQLQRLCGFVDPKSLLEQLETYDWTSQHEIEALISLAKQEENLSVQLKAITFLRTLIYDALTSLGMRAHVTKKFRGSDGTEMTFSADLVRDALASAKSPQLQLPKSIVTIENKVVTTNKTDSSKQKGEPNGNTAGKSDQQATTGESEATNLGAGNRQSDNGSRVDNPAKSSVRGHRPPIDSSPIFSGIATPSDSDRWDKT
jgi:hypothetical protein